jgi:hypothetical protein
MSIKETYNDEINLLDLFKAISLGKKKIIIIIIITIFCVIGISKIQPTPTIKSITEIKPLSEGQLNFFELSNSLNIYNINTAILYENFFDVLEKRTALRSAVKKFGFVSREDYENDEKYEEAVSLASHEIEINFFRPYGVYRDREIEDKYSSIVIIGSDENELFEIIKYIKDENNKLAIKNIEQEFERKIFILRKLNELEKRKIVIEIQNKKDEYDVLTNQALQNLKFQIEDINAEIANSIKDYEYRITKRLRYLKEQASIARKLDVATIDKNYKTFGASGANLGVTDGGPFYLMGYVAIEKEIEIIKNRKNIEVFAIDEKLISKKRELEQNRIEERKDQNKLYLERILTLKNQLRDMNRKEILFSRAEVSFKQNLKEFAENFESVIFDPYSTKFETQPAITFFKLLLMAIFLGSIIGLLYVIIERKKFVLKSLI